MPRRNRVDPWGDLHEVPGRGMFTGNRGCLVDDDGQLTRHHSGSLWITCRTSYQDWSHPLDAPRTWTPLFFLDDAVALAAGHRPCGLCRRSDYEAYRAGVSAGLGQAVHSDDLNRRLSEERLNRGRGLDRAGDRILWMSDIDDLPNGTVVLDPVSRSPSLLSERGVEEFSFHGWGKRRARPATLEVQVLTPPTSVMAIRNGFKPRLHTTASTG